jgi:hypothetical protein
VVVVGSMVCGSGMAKACQAVLGMAKRRQNGSGREFSLRVGFRKRVEGMPSSLGHGVS